MRENRKRNSFFDNNGSTLLTILICAAFIGILGTLMISVTLTNLEMKMVDSKSKANFYSCEAAMEEIRTGIQELATSSIQTVYEEQVLVNYATYLTMPEDQVNTDIQNRVTGKLMKALVQTSETDESRLVSVQNLTANLDSFKKYLINSSLNNPDLSIASVSSYGNSIIIKDIKIAYIKDDYKTSITTDIKIALPQFSVGETAANDNYQLKQPFEKYVLVADGGITSDNSYGTNTITGSVYAGDSGILVHSPEGYSHNVIIQGSNIVTRKNITVSDGGNLTIGDPVLTEKPIIWADNIMTEAASENMHPVLKINGISLIKGDLVLNGYNSEVAFTGAYVGFSGYHTKMGSAIMVNGSESALDLSGLSSLMLRGRAYVMAGDTRTGDTLSPSDILTGESVAIKSNQRAYLVPGKYIGNSTSPVNHNPVSKNDITSLGAIPTVDTASLKLEYPSYVAADAPYKMATKHIGGIGDDDPLYYYYLNFGSGKQADNFIWNYYNAHPEVLNHPEPFKIRYLRLPIEDKIKTVGNAASYSDTENKVKLNAGLSAKPEYPTDTDLDTKFQNFTLDDSIYSDLKGITVGSLNSKYSKMTHLLSLEDKEYTDSEVVASSLYIKSLLPSTDHDHGVDNVAASDTLKVYGNDYGLVKLKSPTTGSNLDYSDTNERIIVIDGNVDIEANSKIYGLLIASGDITIGDKAEINGMVISTCEKGMNGITLGNEIHVNGRLVSRNHIKLGTNCTLKLDNDAENNIKEIFSKEGALLQYLFKNVDVTENLTLKRNPLINMSNMITYVNWRKNE